jgi:uncharacterized membrane protein YccC
LTADPAGTLDAARQVTTVLLGVLVTYGAADDSSYLALRVGEALFGAVVGIAVSALVAPPLYLWHAGNAVASLGAEIVELLETITRGLREGRDEHDARRRRRTARQLEATVRHAENAVEEGRESTVFNVRRLWSRQPPVVARHRPGVQRRPRRPARGTRRRRVRLPRAPGPAPSRP